ncbi:hypothetical protein HYY69_06950 [Candidatus Woesearchaeota archaeon]|nr:hypothetical protein [Candidatus Woesearchaeota archaeon]
MTKTREITAKTLRTIAWQVGNTILKPTRAEIQRYGLGGLATQKPSVGLTADLVTKADTASEQYIIQKLLNLDPDLTVIGEESGRRHGRSTIAGIFDPLDGTDTYAGTLERILDGPENVKYRQDCHVRIKADDFNKYTVHIMYAIQNRVIIDVAFSPDRGLLTWAGEGEGAWMCNLNDENPLVIELSASRKQIFQSSVIADGYVPSKLTEQYTAQYKPVLEALAGLKTHFRRFGYTSAVYEALSTVIPENHADARAMYIGPHVCVWDVPILLLQEAGADALVIREHDRRFSIAPFSLKDFRIYDPQSELYKDPFFVVVGEKEMLGRLDTKILGHLPRLER